MLAFPLCLVTPSGPWGDPWCTINLDGTLAWALGQEELERSSRMVLVLAIWRVLAMVYGSLFQWSERHGKPCFRGGVRRLVCSVIACCMRGAAVDIRDVRLEIILKRSFAY